MVHRSPRVISPIPKYIVVIDIPEHVVFLICGTRVFIISWKNRVLFKCPLTHWKLKNELKPLSHS